jgi:hypothetical protein
MSSAVFTKDKVEDIYPYTHSGDAAAYAWLQLYLYDATSYRDELGIIRWIETKPNLFIKNKSSHFTYDCDDIRKRIALYTAHPGHTKAGLLRELGNINSNTLNRFLSRKGPHEGNSLGIYPAAIKFFSQLDNNGEPELNSNSAITATSTTSSGNENNNKRKSSSSPAKLSRAEKLQKVEELTQELNAMESSDEEEDEEENNMTKFVSCNTIRKKINEFLATSGWAQSDWLKYTGVNSKSYQMFMSYRGPIQGIDNQTYSKGKSFFRKLDELNKEKKKQGKVTPKKRKVEIALSNSNNNENNAAQVTSSNKSDTKDKTPKTMKQATLNFFASKAAKSPEAKEEKVEMTVDLTGKDEETSNADNINETKNSNIKETNNSNAAVNASKAVDEKMKGEAAEKQLLEELKEIDKKFPGYFRFQLTYLSGSAGAGEEEDDEEDEHDDNEEEGGKDKSSAKFTLAQLRTMKHIWISEAIKEIWDRIHKGLVRSVNSDDDDDCIWMTNTASSLPAMIFFKGMISRDFRKAFREKDYAKAFMVLFALTMEMKKNDFWVSFNTNLTFYNSLTVSADSLSSH